MSFGNVLILGDSYSTFEGYIPKGYDVYYQGDGSYDTGVTRVEETWWHQLITETKSNLVLNDSWSGSTICYKGYDDCDCSETSSFICRLEKMNKNGFFEENKIDTLFIFGATNDSWIGVPLGEEKYENFTKDELFTVLPAICCLVKRAREILPNAKIYYIINTELKEEIVNTILSACKKYGASTVTLADIDKVKGHPTIKGMAQIKNQILLSVE
jgi:hypothetical protein